MTQDHRPSWIDYWESPHPLDPSWPDFNPNWRKAAHQHGIAFNAPWEEPFAGFPEHARRCAVALASTGVPVHLRSARANLQFFSFKDPEAAMEFERIKTALADLLSADVKGYDVDIWQVVADDSSFFRLAGPKHHWMDPKELAAVHSRRIISTVFERDRLSDSASECLGRVAQVWVANDHDRTMLGRCGIDEGRVHVIPVPFFPNDPHLALDGRTRVGGPVRFYHIGKWEPRKEHRNIIGAFLLAFRPGQAKLYLKTSAQGPRLTTEYPQSPTECTRRWLADERVKKRGWTVAELNRSVVIFQQRLTGAQILSLHRQGDVYVTLSRGEGFDMPAFDAKLSGNMMVYTPSGGPQSFAGEHDELVEATGSVPCDPFYRWGPARYLDYDLDAVIERFKAAADAVAQSSVRKRDVDLGRFSAAVVGAKMRQCVEEVRGG